MNNSAMLRIFLLCALVLVVGAKQFDRFSLGSLNSFFNHSWGPIKFVKKIHTFEGDYSGYRDYAELSGHGGHGGHGGLGGFDGYGGLGGLGEFHGIGGQSGRKVSFEYSGKGANILQKTPAPKVNNNGLLESGVSKQEENVIIQLHNQMRLQLARGQVPDQPRASNMLRMRYDYALAREAQKIANTRIFGHVHVNDRRFSVGQNLGQVKTSYYERGSNWTQRISTWWDEHTNYRFRVFSTATGHYAQIAWADTYLIGCGYVHYLDKRSSDYVKYYVCNYGPSGNIMHGAPYKIGTGCVNLCEPH